MIFVHDVRRVLGSWLAAHERSIGYLDTRQMSIFVHNTRHIVHPIYVIWIAFAFVAAYRAAAGAPLLRRTSSSNSKARSFRLSR